MTGIDVCTWSKEIIEKSKMYYKNLNKDVLLIKSVP